jgi:hypothetical protein
MFKIELFDEKRASTSPAINRLLPKLRDRINFRCGNTVLRNVKELGF